MCELVELFLEADSDRSGDLDAEELGGLLRLMYRQVEGTSRPIKAILKALDHELAVRPGSQRGRMNLHEFLEMFCQAEQLELTRASPLVRHIMMEHLRSWRVPLCVTVQCEMDGEVESQELDTVKMAFEQALDARVVRMELLQGDWVHLELQSDDGIALQWRLQAAAGPFTVPGYDIESFQIDATYVMRLRGDSSSFKENNRTFESELSRHTTHELRVLGCTEITACWFDVQVTVQITLPQHLHRVIVDVEGATLVGYEIRSCRLVEPSQANTEQAQPSDEPSTASSSGAVLGDLF